MVKDINEIDFKRTITHTSYKHGDKKVKNGRFSRILEKQITDNKIKLDKKNLGKKNTFQVADLNFISLKSGSKVVPIGGGIFSMIMIIIIIIGGFKFPNEVFSTSYIIPFVISLLSFLFFLSYYFTMPNKENILDRQNGLFTFPGYMWRPNITMSIEKVLFTMSSPSAQGGGAYQLDVIRPDRSYSIYWCSLGNSCYEDLSFFLWYMDKNRPLPPGDAFDEYRQKDFERRKAAGFPEPMFPATFDTPEATPEQQEERNRIGGW